jgi:quercetin dioxygenase-like cupin family protein
MLKQWIAPVVVALLATSGYAQMPQTDLPSPIKRTPLGKAEVPGCGYEVVFGMAELIPGPKTGRHSHPGIVMAYVAEGEFWYLIDGQPERIYKTGDAFQVPDSAVHNEGAVGAKPARVMAVYIVEKGKPLVQPAAAAAQ